MSDNNRPTPRIITLEPDHLNRFWYRHQKRRGWSITRTLIAANVILFLWMVLRGLIAGRGLTTAMGPDLDLLVYAGAQNWGRVFAHGEWWRCISYAYTHGGLLHLAFNMVALYQVGMLLEKEAGRAALLSVYTFSAGTATLAGYLWHPEAYAAWASGALFGLIGFAVVFYRRLGDPHSLAKSKFMLQWALFAFLFGLAINADNAGHFGGAVGGALAAVALPPRFLVQPATPLFLRRLAWLAGFLNVAGLLMLIRFWVVLELGLS